ncbi:Fic family protein [Ralstonia pseudosolanacearum]|uniref:Fic family protein n=1 Tax=Ralstonia pseudosolanacearum TaxID=1310165 RepID=UPI003AB0D233
MRSPVAPSKSEQGPYSTWSPQALELSRRLDVSLLGREPISYHRAFVEAYVPNHSSLIPPEVAEELLSLGCPRGPQRVCDYVPAVLPELLIDLSWNSSRLEGNRYSLHAAEDLLRNGGIALDADAVMLLNHKAAIEFLVDCVRQQGFSTLVVQNLHALLMQDLLPSGMLGSIRRIPVGIEGTRYSPLQAAGVLEQMLNFIVDKAILIQHPVEAALFLWVNLAYLQPFADGNKRTSRLAANIPLLINNCMPLSFLDVEPRDYARAMLGVYELQDVALAVDLLSWTYRRSIERYSALIKSKG